MRRLNKSWFVPGFALLIVGLSVPNMAQAAARTYYMYFNTGTVLAQPPVTTNTTCPVGSDIQLNGVSGIALMADADDVTCTPANNRDVIWNSAAPTLSLYYNGAGYATAMNVTGTSIGIRVRSQSASATSTVKLFYTTSGNSKVYFTGSATQAVTKKRTDYTVSLAGLSASNVPAGSKIGVEFSWNDPNGMHLTVNNSASNDKLVVDETVSPSLFAYYAMDETSWGAVGDSSGNGLNGTVIGSATPTGHPPPSPPGSAIPGTTGTCGAGSIPNGTHGVDTGIDVDGDIGDIGTIAFWYAGNTAWNDGTDRMLLDASNDLGNGKADKHFYVVKGDGGEIRFGLEKSDDGNELVSTGGNAFAANTWHHIAITWNWTTGTMRVYLDGTEEGNTTINKNIGNYANLYLGTTHSGIQGGDTDFTTNSANGYLDEVRIYRGELSAGDVSAVMALTHPCIGGLHHLRIEHSGSGVTCTPTTLTIKACADASCSSLFTGSVTGTMTATGAPTVNWVGGTSFNIGASGSVTRNVQVTTAGTVDWGTSNEAPAPGSATDCFIGATPSCSFTSALAGFLFDVPNHVSDTVQNITVSAVKQADNSLACVPAFASTSKTVNFACAYSDPASGTLPVAVGGSAVSCGVSSGVSLSFDATGVASTTVQYADVGQIALSASYSGSGGSETGLVMTGNDPFIAAPASFSVTGVTAGPIKAGNDFSATVTALNASGNATPNFGNETAPEGVTLTSTLVSPVGGANPALGNGGILGGAFSNGVATVNNLNWGEVGNITLDAALTSGSYLGSGLSANGSAAAGVFIPDHFSTEVLAVSGVPMPCPTGLTCPAQYNGFVYSGQSFSVRVTALNLGGGTTSNYDGALGFSRDVTLAAWDALGSTTTQNPGGGTLANNSITAASFTAGVATTATPTYTFAATTAPTDIYLRATNTDGATSLRTIPTSSVEGGVKVVSGRVKVTNAYGSNLLPLTLPTTVQYYDGTRWLTSTTDSITTLSLPTSFSVGGGPDTTTPSCDPPSCVFSSGGNLSINLSPPSNGASGSVNVEPAIAVGSPGNPPLPIVPGTATFGIYKGNNEMIYRREAY